MNIDNRITPKRILVTSDDPIIQKLNVIMLEYLGFDATICNDGAEAITLYKCSKEAGVPFDAVITDVEVPGGVGGEETAKQILAIDPNAILIVASANHEHHCITDYSGYGFCCALRKPYNLSQFSDAIAIALRNR